MPEQLTPDQLKRITDLERPVLWAQRRGEAIGPELRRAIVSAMAYGASEKSESQDIDTPPMEGTVTACFGGDHIVSGAWASEKERQG